jgi:hypothetical protein
MIPIALRKTLYPGLLEFDRVLFKVFSLVLLFFMVVRHAMFYLLTGYINTEIGFDQSFSVFYCCP